MLEVIRSDTNAVGEVLAVLLLLGPFALAVYGMWRGYQRRRRADEALFGRVPTTEAPAREPDGHALYTGTTAGGSQVRRVAAGGLFGRGPCRYWLEADGLVFQRHRGPVVVVRDVRDIGLIGAHAGRVIAPRRIAVVRWLLGGHEVDTGFAFEDADAATRFAGAVRDTVRSGV